MVKDLNQKYINAALQGIEYAKEIVFFTLILFTASTYLKFSADYLVFRKCSFLRTVDCVLYAQNDELVN